MKFYDPDRTFLDLVSHYKGDLEEAYDQFEHNWGELDTRTLQDAIGLNDEDYLKFELFELDVKDIVLKYRNKTAASVQNN